MTAQRCISMFVLIAVQAVAQEEGSKPDELLFVGEVTANNVYVRSGPSTNYYEVAKLDAGQRVRVYGEEPDWYAIAPPEECFSVIHENYIDVDASGDSGTVNANNVLVRAGSALRPELYAKQLKLQRGAVVHILEPHNEDYLRIRPPAEARLYISKQFVARAPTNEPPTRPAAEPAEAAALTGQTESPTAETPAGEGAAPATEAKPPLEPGKFQERIAELDAAVEKEMNRPLLQREFEPLIEQYRALSKQDVDPYARAYAKARIRQLEQSRESIVALRQLRELADRVATERKKSLKERNAIRPPVPSIGGGFDAVGELRPSVLFSSPVGPRWYRLVNADQEPLRTIGYIEVPEDSSIDVTRFLGRKVGVRARERRLLTGDVDPLEVFVVSELVGLDVESGDG